MNWDLILETICSFWFLLIIWTSILGIVLIISALMILAFNNGGGNTSRSQVGWLFGAGIFLFSFERIVSTVSQTLGMPAFDRNPVFCLASSEVFSYFNTSGSGSSQAVGIAYAMLIFIGGVSIYRALLMLKERGTANTNVSFGSIIVHLITGVLLFNVQSTDQTMGNLFGLTKGLIGSVGIIGGQG